MKHKIKRVLALSAVLCFMFSTVVFAEVKTFAGDATARLTAEISGDQSRCIASTYLGTGHTFSSYYMTVTFEDGSEVFEESGFVQGTATNMYNLIWRSEVEDYKCSHAVYDSDRKEKDFIILYQ